MRTLYAIRLHDRITEADQQLGTVMYATEPHGPWFDMATGHPDWCWEILDALEIAQEKRQEQR